MDEKTAVKSGRSLKPVIIGVGVVLAILVIGCSAFLGVYLSRVEDKLEWDSVRGRYGNDRAEMREQVQIDMTRQTILHVNADGWRAGINNSVTLQDYNAGLLALKMVNTDECHVQKMSESFESALQVVRDYKNAGQYAYRPVVYYKKGALIPEAGKEEEVGKEIADFCRDIPTYRMVYQSVLPKTREARGVRRTSCSRYSHSCLCCATLTCHAHCRKSSG